MEQYIVVYIDEIVAHFETVLDCHNYIKEQLENDDELNIKDFYIFSLIG